MRFTPDLGGVPNKVGSVCTVIEDTKTMETKDTTTESSVN